MILAGTRPIKHNGEYITRTLLYFLNEQGKALGIRQTSLMFWNGTKFTTKIDFPVDVRQLNRF